MSGPGSTTPVRITQVLLLSVCLGHNVATKVRDIEDTHHQPSFLEEDARPQLIRNSPRIKRYGVSNETLVIPGKIRNVTSQDVTSRISENDNKPRILLEKINSSDNSEWRFKGNAGNTQTGESYRADLERDEDQSLKPPGHPETYKMTESLQGRPAFHIVREDFSNRDIPLRREARLNIDNDQLEFPSFATQFFGSFGEFSQSFTESSHNDDHHYDPYTKNYNQKPHSDFRPHHDRPHHDRPHDGFQSQHHGYEPHLEKPRPLKPPKREIISSYHDKPANEQYNSIKDVSALYVEDPWKHIDKVVDSPPPYVPKPVHQDGYDQGGFEHYNDIHQPEYHDPVYDPPQPVYSPPEPIVYDPPKPEYEPVHVEYEEYIPDVHPVYHPPKPKPVFHYSKPNYRPPIQQKPIKDQHHAIVSVPHGEPDIHYDAPHHPEVHSLDGDHHPSEYLHPVQHMKDKKGELDFYKKYANRIHGSKALNFNVPLSGTRAGGARFLHLPGGRPGSTFSSHEIEFGGESGSYGAFRWFSDHPTLFF